MATLAVAAGASALGGGLGWMVGYAGTGMAMGWTIGAYAGMELFGAPGQGAQDQEGPRLEDLTVQSSAYGEPLPIVYGSARIAGNIIWSAGIQEHKHEEEVGGGGKGGGGESATRTSYTYTCSFAVGLCEGEIAGVRRIWADGKLMFDKSENSTYNEQVASDEVADSISVYTGTETQEPDPVIESHEGSGNVPGYRGLAYLVFENLKLEDYGNHVPNIEVELAVGLSTENFRVYLNEFRDFTIKDGHIITLRMIEEDYDKARWWYAIDYYNYSGELLVSNKFSLPSLDEYYDYRMSIARDLTSSEPIIYIVMVSEDGVGGEFTRRFNAHTGEWLNSVVPKMGWNTPHVSTGYNPDLSNEPLLCNTYGYYLNEEFTADFYSLITGGKLGGYVLQFPEGTSSRPNAHIGVGGQIIGHGGDTGDPEVTWIWRIDRRKPIDSLDTGNVEQYSITDAGNMVCRPSNYYLDFYQGISADRVKTYAYEGGGTNKTGLDAIVSDILSRAGLDAALYDTTELSSESLIGYAITSQMSSKEALDPLMQAFQFDLVESDWQIICRKRGNATALSIPDEDLAAHESGEGDAPDELRTTRTLEREIPREFVIEYQDVDVDYQVNAQRVQRFETSSDNKQTKRLPLVLDSTQALQIAETLFQTAWIQQHNYEFQTGADYVDRLPGDVIEVKGQRVLLQNASYRFPGIIEFSGPREDVTSYESSSQAESPEFPSQSVTVGANISGILLDIPALNNVYDSPGLFAVAFAIGGDFPGVVVYKSTDDGQSWKDVTTLFTEPLAANVPGEIGPGTTTRWDMENTLTIEPINDKTPESASELSVMDGTNTVVLGDQESGNWEVLSYVDVTDNGDGSFTLSKLIRGRRGTTNKVDSHTNGEVMIHLNEDTIGHIPLSESNVDTTVMYKFAAVGARLQDYSAKYFTTKGRIIYPWNPVHIEGKRNSSGDLTITWLRRSRSVYSNWNVGRDVRLAEDTEEYEVDILDSDGNVVRTLTTSGTDSDQSGVTYTATEQTEDFGSAQSSISVIVYQIGDTIGRGSPGEATV